MIHLLRIGKFLALRPAGGTGEPRQLQLKFSGDAELKAGLA
jgi:hypothetical protein